MISMERWLTWNGQFSFRGDCNRLDQGLDRVISEKSGFRLDPDRSRAVPLVSPGVRLALKDCKLRENQVWINFSLQQPQRVRALLFRIYAGEIGAANLVYQEVLDGETLSGLPTEPKALNFQKEEQDTLDLGVIEDQAVSFHVVLWITTLAGDFREQRKGSRYDPGFRPHSCFPHTWRPAPKKTEKAGPAAEVQTSATDQEITTRNTGSVAGYGNAPSGAWQAWQAPDPVLANMVRSQAGELDQSSVIQGAGIPEALRWQAWKAPEPQMAAQTRVTQLPQPQMNIAPEKAEPLYIWPALCDKIDPDKNKIPGLFEIHLVLPAQSSPEPQNSLNFSAKNQTLPGLILQARPAERTRAEQRPEVPMVLVRGIRGVVSIEGVHFTELYNYDHPDNLFKSAAFLMEHHFGSAPDYARLRLKAATLLGLLFNFAQSSSPWQQALVDLISPALGQTSEEPELLLHKYLETINQEQFRGDPLQVAALEVLLGVDLQVYRPDGSGQPVPDLGHSRHFHQFHLSVRTPEGRAKPRFQPLTEQMPDLAGTSPIPYDPSASEIEGLYRDATLSRQYKSRTPATLLRRVTRFYRINHFRLVTGDQL